MAAIPYMKWFPADYLSDTAHLSTLEHGAYLLLIMNYWQRGRPLPADPVRLARIAGLSEDEWERVEPVVEEYFDIEDGEWIHRRIESDLDDAKARSAAARRAGEKSGKARKPTSRRIQNERSTNVQRMLNGCSTDAERMPNERATIEREIEREKESKKKPIASASPTRGVFEDLVPESLATQEFLSSWKEWCSYRREIRKALKPTTARKQLAKLEKWGPRVAALSLEQSMTNQWTGIFEPKDAPPPVEPEREDLDPERRDLIVRLVEASNAGELPPERYRELNGMVEKATTRAALSAASREAQEALSA